MDHVLNQQRISKRLKTVGLSYVDSNRYAQYALYQIEHQGLENTIKFFKRIGDIILSARFGSPEKPTWVKTKHKYPASLSFLKDYNDQILLRVAKFARAFRFKSTRSSQVDKILNAIIAPYGGSESGLKRLSDTIVSGINLLKLHELKVESVQKPADIFHTFKRTLSTSGMTAGCKKIPLKESIKHLANTPIMKLIPFRECFFPLGFRSQDRLLSLAEGSHENLFIGEYNGAQEGGGKLRGYASPYSVFQVQSSPIMDWIRQYHRVLKTDCTMVQEDGAIWAQNMLLQGKTVYSVDLSTATCRFPLGPQLDMLKVLGLPENYINALEFMCRGKYRVDIDNLVGFPREVQWKVGQPLGIKPSIAMFSLAHNLLLSGLCGELGLSPENSFRVLGDDVVMVDEQLHVTYRALMKMVDVPISENKCHSSSKFAEFAGYSITREVMLRPGQWKEAELCNHLDLSMELGLPLKGEVQQTWLNAEKLSLFINDKFAPSLDQYKEYLFRASSLFQSDFDLPDDLPSNGYDWNVRRFCEEQFPKEKLSFLPGDCNPVREIFKNLPSHPIIDLWRSNSYDLDIDSFGTYQVLLNSNIALSNLYQNGDITRDEFIKYNELAFANALKLFWNPPKPITELEDIKTKKLVKAWNACKHFDWDNH